MTAGAPRGDLLHERASWLVRLRWIALAGVLAATAAAAALRAVADAMPLLAIALVMGLLNARWWWRSRRAPALACEPGSILAQLVVDLCGLTLLLYWSGGVENPFSTFLAFHMALAAMLLPRRQGAWFVAAACFLYGGLVLGELLGVLPHHPLRIAPGEPQGFARSYVLVAGKSIAVLGLLVGVYYFVRSVVERQQRAERLRREQETLAAERERLARVGEISAGAAHAVRNPLHGLINCVDVLMASADAEAAETLALMSDALQRIEQVTGALLGLARNAPLRKTPTDVDGLVADALAAMSPRARGTPAQIEAHLGAVGAAEVDPSCIGEALSNVLGNALDACAQGGTIAVRTYEESAPAQAVVIEVSDTGTGIAPEHLGMVFTPFFTTKALREGTGLGLAITRRILEEHGGRVALDSAPGRGTSVRLIVPRKSRGGQESTAT